MTTTAVPERSATAILREATETIEASYWIQSEENEQAEWDSINELQEAIESARKGETKGKVVGIPFQLSDGDPAQRVVTGVCSIGAIALAESILYLEPLRPYATMAKEDPHTAIAGAAVARAILRDETREHVEDLSEVVTIIVGWNDSGGVDKDDVVRVFRAALTDPILTAETVWQVDDTGLTFASEQEAKDCVEHYRKVIHPQWLKAGGENRYYSTTEFLDTLDKPLDPFQEAMLRVFYVSNEADLDLSLSVSVYASITR